MNKVYFSPGYDCKDAIINQLKKAQDTIRICVFTISDNDITDAIISAHRRGVTVTVITDNDKVNDKGSDIEGIYKSGIEVRTDHGPSHMHHKFAIFDDERLITGSFNWTRSATKYNQENVILSNNEDLLEKHIEYYHDLWQTMKRFY